MYIIYSVLWDSRYELKSIRYILMNIIKYHSDIQKLCTQTAHLKNPLYLFALGLEYILVFSIKISTREIFFRLFLETIVRIKL